jgi:large subunit ribosomal protein L35
VPRKSTRKGKYKLKTHKATSKRFRVTGSGKLVRTKGGKSHFRRRRSARAKSQYARMQSVKGAKLIRTVKRLAPYLDQYKANPNVRG